MSSIMPRTMPCVRCKVTPMKTRGAITGMCKACRLADPAMAAIQRANHEAIGREVRAMVEATSDPVPGRPGIRKVRPGAIDAYFKGKTRGR